MANKFKQLFLSAALLLSGVALASCDDIEATPDWGDDDVIFTNEDITNNEIKKIYEALVKPGAANSEKVLTELLKRLSKSYFGDFYGEGGLHDAFTNSKVADFVAAHPIYNESLDKTTDEHGDVRAKMYYDYLVKQIKKSFVTAVKNPAYQDRNLFKEKEFFDATAANGYDLVKPAQFKEVKVNGNVDEDSVDAYFSDTFLTDYADYIERSILPSLYEKKLVEYFITKENPGALGRTYAREVEYIKVSDNSEYSTTMNKLTKAYAKLVLESDSQNAGFDFLSDLVKGTVYFNGTNEERALADAIYAEAEMTDNVQTVTLYGGTANEITYTAPVETTLGGYLKSYNKIKDNRDENDKTAYNDFTSNGAYIKEVGLQMKVDSLVAQSTIASDGWYTSSTMSGIPAETKNRLFKVKVSSELDNKDKAPTYGVKRFGSYYMTPETYQKDDELPYVIYADSASYIVRVKEAISVAKLQKDSTESYDIIHAGETLFREKIAYEAAHLISDNDTYIKNAKQYFVEKAKLAFHDDYVYDYFADTFPDLFESND